MVARLTIQAEGPGFLAEGKIGERPLLVETTTIEALRTEVQQRLLGFAAADRAAVEVVLDDRVLGQSVQVRATPQGAVEVLSIPASSQFESPSTHLDDTPVPAPDLAVPLMPPSPANTLATGTAAAPIAHAAPAPIPEPPQQAAPSPTVAPPIAEASPAAAHAAPPVPSPAPPLAPLVRPTRADLVKARPGAPIAPAVLGWRGAVNRASLGRLHLAPGEFEQRHRAAIASVQRSLSGPKTIVVLNPKGGAHKTTATLMIAATFGVHRGGSTLAWDNNETQGTLGARAIAAHHTNTAVSLLGDVDRFRQIESARFGDLDNYVRNQGEAKFDVLASDDDPTSPKIMTGEDFTLLHDTLARFYRVIVVDTGNNPRASNWQAAVDAADQIVIVSTLREDTASVAAGLADRLHDLGLGAKLERGVTVLSEPSASRDRELTARLTEHFARLTRAVTIVPYEPAFVGGGELNLQLLRPATREAWLQASSLIAEGLNR